MISKVTEQPSPQRPNQEARRKQQGSIKLLYDWVGVGKECTGEIQREGRISVEVIPLNEIAN